MDLKTQANCPYCLSTEGYVRHVTIKDDRQTMIYTCENCKRTWQSATQRIIQPLQERIERVDR